VDFDVPEAVCDGLDSPGNSSIGYGRTLTARQARSCTTNYGVLERRQGQGGAYLRGEIGYRELEERMDEVMGIADGSVEHGVVLEANSSTSD